LPDFNWECSVRELRVHDPGTAEQHGLQNKGFIATNNCKTSTDHPPFALLPEKKCKKSGPSCDYLK